MVLLSASWEVRSGRGSGVGAVGVLNTDDSLARHVAQASEADVGGTRNR